MNIGEINNFLGDMDIELLDQVLKGSFEDCEKILEIGCGQGRNLIYFMKEGFNVFGVDRDRSSIDLCNYISNELNVSESTNFSKQDASKLSFDDSSFDAVINSRMLHFANSHEEFSTIWSEQYRVLKNRGLLFFTMDTNIGQNLELEKIEDWKWKLPDGTVRFLLTSDLLNELRIEDQFDWLETLKVVNFNNQHCYAVLVLQKKQE